MPDPEHVLECLRNHKDQLGDDCGNILDEFDGKMCENKMPCWDEMEKSVDACLDDTKIFCPRATEDMKLWHMCIAEHESQLSDGCKRSGEVVHKCFKDHPMPRPPPLEAVITVRHRVHNLVHKDGTREHDSSTSVDTEPARGAGEHPPYDQLQDPPHGNRNATDAILLVFAVSFIATILSLLFLTCVKYIYTKLRERREERFIPIDRSLGVGFAQDSLFIPERMPEQTPAV